MGKCPNCGFYIVAPLTAIIVKCHRCLKWWSIDDLEKDDG